MFVFILFLFIYLSYLDFCDASKLFKMFFARIFPNWLFRNLRFLFRLLKLERWKSKIENELLNITISDLTITSFSCFAVPPRTIKIRHCNLISGFNKYITNARIWITVIPVRLWVFDNYFRVSQRKTIAIPETALYFLFDGSPRCTCILLQFRTITCWNMLRHVFELLTTQQLLA